MNEDNTPISPLPEVLPDVDLPCQCGGAHRPYRECPNFRGARRDSNCYQVGGLLFVVERVPWALVRAALAAEQKPWVPTVGEMCEGVNIATGVAYRGHYHGPAFWNGHEAAVLTDRKGEVYPGQYTKRASLRPIQSSPPAPAATEQGNRNARHCNSCPNPAVGGGHYCNEHLLIARPDPYAAHREDLANCNLKSEAEIAAMTELDPLNRKARQARELLDLAYVRRYPYAESSSVFSSATWESE